MKFITRFAPTPSGALHFGSLVAALGSYLWAKKNDGLWKLRIDDLDTLRVVPGSVEMIQSQLERYGLEHDGPVEFQSNHIDEYAAALETLRQQSQVFNCNCSRKNLDDQGARRNQFGERIYPGTCTSLLRPFASGLAVRLRINSSNPISSFSDGLMGQQEVDLSKEWPGVVMRRADGVFAYHLANVVDDCREDVTHVVRGADLLGVTHVHRYLSNLLYGKTPDYSHLPLAVDEDGFKLSKSKASAKLPDSNQKEMLEHLSRAFLHLGYSPFEEIRSYQSCREMIAATLKRF